jgi:hypothetical protein
MRVNQMLLTTPRPLGAALNGFLGAAKYLGLRQIRCVPVDAR